MAIDIKDIEQRLGKLLGRGGSRAVIKREDVLKHIDMSRRYLNTFKETFESLGEDKLQQLWQQTQSLQNDDYFASTYVEFVNRLNSKAAKAEASKPFSVCLRTARQLADMLNEVEQNVQDLFPEKFNLHSARYSHLAALGAIHACDEFARFCTFLYQGVVWESIKETKEPAPYRFQYVRNNFWFALNLVNRTFSGTGPVKLNSIIKELEKSNNDISVTNDDGEPNTAFFNKSRAGSVTMNLLGTALENPMWILGKLYVEWRQQRMDKIEQERDWIEANVALLKMELEDTDPDSEEYQRLVKIINNYEGMLAKADRKLDEYYDKQKGD